MQFFQQLMAEFTAWSVWELAASVLAIVYLVLAIRERISCWYAAFVSTAIFTFLFWHVNLFMDSALNIYYMAMAVYGWYEWRYGGSGHEGVHIHRWNIRQHAMAISLIILASFLSGYGLDNHTEAAWPYLDSFTTWASVLTTWMVARKVLENWLYWLVIDAVAIFMYLERELYFTAVLFAIYVIMVIFGYRQWRKQYQLQQMA